MLRILITGGSGFIGTNLVSHYLDRGDSVLSLDTASPRCRAHENVWKSVDLLNMPALAQAIEKFAPELVLHMGARTDLDGRSIADYQANTTGVQNLLAAMDRVDTIKRVIFASSRMVCRIGYQPKNDGDYCPSTIYGESKVIGEKIIREAGIDSYEWVQIRPTSIWGPWFDVPYRSFFNLIAKGLYFHPGNRKIYKSFGYVGNSVYQIQKLVEAEASRVNGRTFYLADYPPIEIGQFATEIQRALDAPMVRGIHPFFLRTLAHVGDLLQAFGWNNPPLTSFRLDNLLTQMVHDLSTLQEVVGPLPYTMQDGVKATTAWMMNEGRQ